MKLEHQVTANIIKKLFKSEDYRIEIITLLDAAFFDFVIQFFKRVIEAKLQSDEITKDWYRARFLVEAQSKDDAAICSGMNMKTIQNMFNTTRREVVIDASINHYDELCRHIDSLIEEGGGLNIELTLKFRNVSVDLNLNETLIVINALAVKRAEISGGLWSTAGKQVEKSLMRTLCMVYKVPNEHWRIPTQPKSLREVDFYLLGGDRKTQYRCEVKLMGKGNPESADAIIARDTQVFIADKLGPTGKTQMDRLGVDWVELRSEKGFRKLKDILDKLDIPHSDISSNLDMDSELDAILSRIL